MLCLGRNYGNGHKKAAGRVAENDRKMLRRMAQGYEDDYGFADILDRFERHEFAHMGTIPVCKTPNVLALGEANLELDMVINPSTILKCMSKPQQRYHGHDLDKDIFKYLIYELRNPVMLLRGSQEGTLVAVTDLIDRQGRPIIVSIALNRKNAHHLVNQITSAYGRNDFDRYLRKQIEKGNLIAINKIKANQMLQSAGVQFPMEEALICFDNSIAYTLRNVKVVEVKKYQENFSSRLDDVISGARERSRAARGEKGLSRIKDTPQDKGERIKD